MIIHVEHKLDQAPQYRVYDAAGNPIDCIEYDTETQEVTMQIPIRSKWAANFLPTPMQHWVPEEGAQPVIVQVQVAGSYATDHTGKRL